MLLIQNKPKGLSSFIENEENEENEGYYCKRPINKIRKRTVIVNQYIKSKNICLTVKLLVFPV